LADRTFLPNAGWLACYIFIIASGMPTECLGERAERGGFEPSDRAGTLRQNTNNFLDGCTFCSLSMSMSLMANLLLLHLSLMANEFDVHLV